MDKTQKLSFYKTQTVRKWQNSKTQNVTKLKKINGKNTKTKNAKKKKCGKTKKIKLWQNSKTQGMTKLKTQNMTKLEKYK